MEKVVPKISILLPIFNAENYLKEALESILNQSFNNWELVAVNDSSTDRSLEILKHYQTKDKRISFFSVRKQNSLADVLNLGLEKCVGKYIIRMDADDIMLSNRLSLQFEFMEQHPEVVVCGGQIQFIDSKGIEIGFRSYALDDDRLRKTFFLFSPFAHPATIIRKESLEKVGGYENNLQKVEDIMLWFKLAKVGKFANIPQTVLKYRITDNSQSLSNKYEHYLLTYKLRKQVIKKGIYKASIYQKIQMEIQKYVAYMSQFLPSNWFMKFFEFGRKILSK